MAEPQHKTDPRPQIKPDDHRHGTNAGHVAGCRSECCNLAKLRYDKARKLERHATGRARQVSAVGFKRRAHALNAIGWPMRLLADELGVTLGTFSARVYRADLVYIRTHELMCDLYERLCMTPYQGPQSERTKRQARERGYAPPLAWDDIDNDDAPNLTPEIVCVDEVKVERVLGGVREDCNLPERLAVLERWQGSYAELERITGWNVNRMLGKVAA